MTGFRGCRAGLARFARASDGAATIEAVLWLPVFMMLLALFADLATIFTNQSRILRLMQDTNRAVAVGRLDGAEAAQTFLMQQLLPLSPKATVETRIAAGRVATIVRVPVTDLDAVGVAGIFRSSVLTLRSDQLVEY
ncbi:MAG: pilus assembly protein [Rhodobacteraceae bacterium]|nr:pilus assembly protein [Paracoccaceae bacterium]